MNKLTKQCAPFTQVPNALLADPDLSLKAKGLYALMYSKPDGWQFYESALVRESKDGKDSVGSGLDELVSAGWLLRSGGRADDTGRFTAYDYELLVRRDGLSVAGNPLRETRDGKPATNNTDPSNTDKPINTPKAPKGAELVNGAFEDFWKAYPNKVGKPAALRAFVRAKPDQSALLLGLDRWRHSEQWKKDKGRFIPHPTTFLNQRRWEDSPTSAEPPKTDLERRNDEFWDSFVGQSSTNQKQIA
jgi:hypothetical protein